MSYSLVFTCECCYSRKLQQWKQLNIVTKTPDKNEWYFTFLCQPACYISADLWKPQHIFNLHLFKSWTCCFPWGGWDQRGKAGGGGRPRGRLLRGSCPVPVWWDRPWRSLVMIWRREGNLQPLKICTNHFANRCWTQNCPTSAWKKLCAQSLSCVWLCGPMDYNPPGSYGHGIFQARILKWGCHFVFQRIYLTH